MNIVEVIIMKEKYRVKGEASPQEIKRAASLLNERIEAIAKANPSLPQHQVAMLVALNLAHDYLTLKEEYEGMVRMLS